ncbi:MAG: beta-ketoacyl-[acyl-carrier-protein] synthase family protein [Chloroflexi bacterium]|nr:beta-ketoacyl-[acyl-carrier-protein] synthase family protein [Chloroflexota bacterium]
MTPNHRVVISGIGVITPVGSGVDGLWRGVVGTDAAPPASAVRTLTRFDPTPFRSRLAAEIDDFDPLDSMDARRARRLDRFSQLAVAASVQAIGDARLAWGAVGGDGAGCYIGSALGGVAYGEEQHRAYLERGLAGVSPALALAVFGGVGASNVAIELGLRGPVLANGNSCASGTIAIGEAFRLVRAGEAPLILAGGVEAPLAPLTFGAFALIKAMSTANETPWQASRPFDAGRDGFVMGEGAAVLILESLDRARARDARIYAEVRGYATTNDAHHMTVPLPDGRQAARAIRAALADAELEPSDVEYVNAHASATPLGDRAEAAAIHLALGEHAARIPISGTKGLYGHPLGASGAIETALCALAIDRGFLPGTANLAHPDPDCVLNLIPPAGLQRRPRIVLNNAFGFGGTNACLVLTTVK